MISVWMVPVSWFAHPHFDRFLHDFLFSSTATSAPGPRQVESTTAGDVQKSEGLGAEGMKEGIKQ